MEILASDVSEHNRSPLPQRLYLQTGQLGLVYGPTACLTPSPQGVRGHITLEVEDTDCRSNFLLLRHPAELLGPPGLAFLTSDLSSTGFSRMCRE